MLRVFVLFLTLLSVRAIHLHWHVAAMRLVRRDASGWFSYELRRRVLLVAVPGHVSSYPVPREERVRVVRLAGLVLWHQELSIALPNEACSHLGDISPQEFDTRFPSWLQLGPPGRRAAMRRSE